MVLAVISYFQIFANYSRISKNVWNGLTCSFFIVYLFSWTQSRAERDNPSTSVSDNRDNCLASMLDVYIISCFEHL